MHNHFYAGSEPAFEFHNHAGGNTSAGQRNLSRQQPAPAAPAQPTPQQAPAPQPAAPQQATPAQGGSRRPSWLIPALIAAGFLLLLVSALIALQYCSTSNQPAPAPAAATQPAPAPATVTPVTNVAASCFGNLTQVSDLGSQAHQHGDIVVPECGYLIAYGDLYEDGTRTYLVFSPGQKIQRPNGVNLSGAIHFLAITGNSLDDVKHQRDIEVSKLEAAGYRLDP